MIDIEKIKQSVEHFKLNDCPLLVNPTSILELITRLEAAEDQWRICNLHVTQLETKLESAEQDAARYRFLKTGNSCDIELMELNEEDGEYYGVCLVKGDYVDNKIDAAMKDEK